MSPTETRSPTANAGQWIDGEKAYSSNDDYAFAFQVFEPVHTYSVYGFALAGVVITELLIGVEHYVTGPSFAIRIRVYDGTTWSAWSNPFTIETEGMLWLDYTSVFAWTPEKVNAIQVQIKYTIEGGGGCYPNNMYFVGIDDVSLLGKELLDITDWWFYNPKQIKELLERGKKFYVLSWTIEKGWFVDKDSEVVQVDEHQGDYTLYDMYSGELDIDYADEDGKQKKLKWSSHMELTSETLVLYSLNGVDWMLDTAETVYNHWKNGKTVDINHLWWDYTLRAFPITNVKITKKYKDKVYNVWTKGEKKGKDIPLQYKKGKTLTNQEYDMLMHLKKCGVPIGKFPPFLAITTKMPDTAYLDWIPVQATWTVVPIKPSTSIVPLMKGMDLIK